MKSISLSKLGFNEVNGGELMVSPTEAKTYHHTKLRVEPKHEDSATAPSKEDESKDDKKVAVAMDFLRMQLI
ncbi:hypothetical protein CsSME_00046239 [Camellia sinensis var. sinensis]